MSLFTSKDAAGAAKPAKTPPPSSLSVIGAGMTVRGDIETAGVVKVEGTIDGHVQAGSQVLVAKGGVVRGDIETREAVIGGEVAGAISSSERVEIQSGASVQGDVLTRRISVAEGATLNGHIRMGELGERPAAKPPTPAVASMSRPSTPVARVAVSPRATSASAATNH